MRVQAVRLLLSAAMSMLVLQPDDARGQTVALLRGTVVDTQGGVIAGAGVRLIKALTGLERTTTTNADGTFQLTNIPLDTYELRVESPGFVTNSRAMDLRTSIPADVTIVLELPGLAASVTVTATEPLVDTSSAGTRNQVSMTQIEQIPAAGGSRGLESILVSFPGFAQNANGAIHPRGAHNQMTFVVDGLPISDQLTGAFANALDTGIVQAVELMTGNIPAEFGSKVSGVAVITSRSGLGVDRRIAGDVMLSPAGFNTWTTAVQMGGGRGRVGYFGSVTAMRTDRFLDQVSRDNLHNAGRFARGFGRVDFQTPRDMLRFHGMGGRSNFEVTNLRSQQAAGQDQRQTLGDGAVWISYLRILDPSATFETTVGYRATTAWLHPSEGDTPVTASQHRQSSTFTVAGRYTKMFGEHRVRTGFDVQRFPVREEFAMGITHPNFNEPGSDRFNPSLLPHDLTRGGTPFEFDSAQAGRLLSGFAESTFHWYRATVNLGLRYDDYRFLVSGRQFQPRVGVAYQLPGAAGVFRASFNRNYQTPPTENLLLSSSREASELAPESVKQTLGGTFQPIRAERQNVYEVGYQRALGRLANVDVSLYRKDSRDQQDNNNFFDTGIIFPTTLAAIKVEGAELRLMFRRQHALSGTLSLTAGRAISTPPFTGGLFLGQDAVDLLSSGPFRIDHDQRFSLHGTTQYEVADWMWIGAAVRYDSGLVSNPSDPDEVAADPDFADLLPYVNLTSAPPRVRPRTVIDVATGYDVRSAGRKTWGLQLHITNLTNRTALYNFQSVFVGTRLIQPRTFAVRIKRFF